jgi:hypothetical protein
MLPTVATQAARNSRGNGGASAPAKAWGFASLNKAAMSSDVEDDM